MKKSYEIRFERGKKCECPFGMQSQGDNRLEIFKLPKGVAKHRIIIIASEECLQCDHWRLVQWDKSIVKCAHQRATEDVTTIRYYRRKSHE